jgi:hypothetical protein
VGCEEAQLLPELLPELPWDQLVPRDQIWANKGILLGLQPIVVT